MVNHSLSGNSLPKPMSSEDLFDKINRGVIADRAHAMSRNIEMNRPYIEKWKGLQTFVPLLKGKHCVIVGAGASLDEGISSLRKISQRNQIIIIAADMAMLPLLSYKIRPHYVISCETTPRDFFTRCDTSKSTLLAFSGVCNRIVREWKGPIHFYNWMIKGEPYDRMWERAGLSLGFAATGSIVTTQAISIALGCTIASLILVGNDLGFYDRPYAHGTVRDGDNISRASRIRPLGAIEFAQCRAARHYAIPRDRIYHTNHQFLAAKRWLESLFASGHITVYDASIPGCAGKNIEKTTLSHYMENILL
jgi:hypothetical protein